MAEALSRAELEERTGLAVTAKMVFVLAGDDLYHRDGDEWYLYPPRNDESPAEAGLSDRY